MSEEYVSMIFLALAFAVDTYVVFVLPTATLRCLRM
jgi:hypothetical protein